MSWITTKSGKKVNTDWFDEDADRKEKQIKENQSQAKEKTTAENIEDKYKGINIKFKKDASNLDAEGYNNNCVQCAIAFEANMRGNDVEANPFKFGDSATLDKSRNPQKAFNQNDVWEVGRPKREQTIREIELSMEEWGNGSRAIIQEVGKGRRHTMNVINIDGNIFIVDAQKGAHGTPSKMLMGIDTKGMIMFRTDNQPLDNDYAEWAYRRK